MTSNIPDKTRGFLALVAAAALSALPARAQEVQDSTESAPDAAQEEPEAPAGTVPEPGAKAETGEATEGETAAQREADGEGKSDGGPLIVEAEEGSVLDDQTFEGEDDDFTPSEEIPVDQPIPFPVDI